MSFNVKVITPPTVEPVTLAEAKTHCRVDVNDEDGLITALISAARIEVENRSGFALLTQTLELILDAWPYDNPLFPGWPFGKIKIPRPPMQSVTSLTYRDAAGVTTTVNPANYIVAADTVPATICPQFAMTWPVAILSPAEAIRVRYVAGYADAASVPAPLKQAMLLLVGFWYDNRAAGGQTLNDLPFGVDALTMNYRERARIRA